MSVKEKSKRSKQEKELSEKGNRENQKIIKNTGEMAAGGEYIVHKTNLEAQQDKNNAFKRPGPAEFL